MERFCSKCGSLVNGDGAFCPNCGATLESAVDLSKPTSDIMPGTMPGTPVSGAPMNSTPMGAPMNSTPVNNGIPTMNTPVVPTPAPNPYQGTSGYQSVPNYNSMNNVQVNLNTGAQPEMTVGQWVLTIFLTNIMPVLFPPLTSIASLIILLVWAFSAGTHPARRNYAKGFLIWELIGVIIAILIVILAIAGACTCSAVMEDILGQIESEFGDLYASIAK